MRWCQAVRCRGRTNLNEPAFGIDAVNPWLAPQPVAWSVFVPSDRPVANVPDCGTWYPRCLTCTTSGSWRRRASSGTASDCVAQLGHMQKPLIPSQGLSARWNSDCVVDADSRQCVVRVLAAAGPDRYRRPARMLKLRHDARSFLSSMSAATRLGAVRRCARPRPRERVARGGEARHAQ
jgi:hypothetical protein